MKDHVMNLDYTKTFKRIALLFIILAVVTAVAIPLSLSRQISDAAASSSSTPLRSRPPRTARIMRIMRTAASAATGTTEIVSMTVSTHGKAR